MIIAPNNIDIALQQNLIATLSQMKQSGVANLPLVLKYNGTSELTLEFFVDEAKTILLFSQNTISNAVNFTVEATRTLFTPPDSIINNATALSTTLNQPQYYYTASWSDSTIANGVYANNRNLVFTKVMVSTEEKPKFPTGDNSAIMVPGKQKIETYGWGGHPPSGDVKYLLQPYKLFFQINVFGYANLSEAQRVQAGMNVVNMVRLALLQDRYRNLKATQFSKDIDGTEITDFSILPSGDLLRGVITITCASMVSNLSY